MPHATEPLRLGLLLPHFGASAGADRIIDSARRAEEVGFDSVWVRDHLLFEPHGEFEQPNRTFYEALTVLTAVGAVTSRLQLGTGALIPTRHPLHTAQITATMTQLVGPRLLLGFGTGNFDHEFDAVGLGGIPRPDLVETNARILRQAWSGQEVSWKDDAFAFTGAHIEPTPAGGTIPLWYCGNAPASVRRAVAYADGWMPGRISLLTLRRRVEALEAQAAEAGRPRPAVGAIPVTSVEADRGQALASVNVDGLLTWANNARFWVQPPSGRFETADDLDGVMVAGTPDDVVAQCQRMRAAGVDHLVFDLRLKFERLEAQIELLGREVLPRLRERAA